MTKDKNSVGHITFCCFSLFCMFSDSWCKKTNLVPFSGLLLPQENIKKVFIVCLKAEAKTLRVDSDDHFVTRRLQRIEQRLRTDAGSARCCVRRSGRRLRPHLHDQCTCQRACRGRHGRLPPVPPIVLPPEATRTSERRVDANERPHLGAIVIHSF